MPLAPPRLLVLTAPPRHVPDPSPAPTPPPEGPAAPSNLVATAVSPFQIDLTWTDNSNNETGFPIRRAAAPGPTDPLDTAPENATSYSDTSVGPGETWFYTMRATNAAGDSETIGPVSATTPSEGATLTPDFYQPSGNVIVANEYDLRARVLNPDNTINTPYNDADWGFSLPLGGPANITGPDNDILIPDPGSAPAILTVRASYEGAQSLDPTFEDITLNIIDQPSGNFPVVLDPGGSFTTIVSLDGSTKMWPGWTFGGEWADDNRVEVVSDPNSKFGDVIEKRFFLGEEFGGWKGATLRNIGLWSQLYIRLVFMFSSEWVWHPGQGKYVYLHNSGGGGNRRNFILGAGKGTAAQNAFGIPPTRGLPVSVFDFSSGAGQWVPNLPSLPRGEYVTVEWFVGADLGTNDGFLRMALNGAEATDWVLVGGGGTTADLRSGVDWLFNDNVTDKRIGATAEAFLFNGGSGGSIPSNMNIRLSEFFISGLP